MPARPDLAALLADPARVAEVPAEAVPALLHGVHAERSRLRAEEARLDAAEATLMARLAAVSGHGDRLLDVEAMAAKLSTTPDWLRRNAGWLPFARKPSHGQLRFSERGADAWIAAGCPT